MNEIYAIDSTRISHREYWWGSRSPLVLLAWLLKWLRVRIPSSTDDPNFESTQPWVVTELPEDVQQRFQPLAHELSALGFHPVASHCLRDPGTQTTIYWLTFVHESGQHLARIHHRLWAQSQKVSRALFPIFITEFVDETFLVSSVGKLDTLTPETVRMNRMFGVSIVALWTRHQALVVAGRIQPARYATTREDALALTERHHLLLRDFNLARGVFRRRTPQEQAQATAFSVRVTEAQAGGLRYPEIMAELDRLQAHKPGWGNALWLLIGSVIAFIAVGAARWDWKFTLWLIPVLLFHEAGHWLAMRFFGYRNLRMFFIPLFGAAVSGRHWNVPGWKKVLVSLAGPVPGIALGAGVAVAALITKLTWLNEAALMLLILNGFNLLPLLPLDGGHVLQATLFCRNRWLDFGFRVAAVVALFLLGLFGLGPFFFVLPFVLAMGLPVAFKIGKVVEVLRQQDLPQPAPNDDHIPTASAQAIIGALKAEQPTGVADKLIAQQALGVFETLNAHPPGPLATVGLLALHAAAFFGSLLFLVALMAGRVLQGSGEEPSLALTRPPVHEIRCENPPQVWPPADVSTTATTNRSLLISTFAGDAEAESIFITLTNRCPKNARVALVGQSVLFALPTRQETTRDRWLLDLYKHTTNTVLMPDHVPVVMSFTFTAADTATATNLEMELRAFTAADGARLLPPWSPAATGPTYERQRAARQVWLRLDRELGGYWLRPEVKALNKKITTANRRNETNDVARLTTEREEVMRALAAKDQARLRAELTGTPHGALVDLHVRLEAATQPAGRTALLQEIAGQLGAEPDLTRAANLGFVSRHGLIVEARWCALEDPVASLPELAAWLCRREGLRIRYDFAEISEPSGTDAPEEPKADTR